MKWPGLAWPRQHAVKQTVSCLISRFSWGRLHLLDEVLCARARAKKNIMTVTSWEVKFYLEQIFIFCMKIINTPNICYPARVCCAISSEHLAPAYHTPSQGRVVVIEPAGFCPPPDIQLASYLQCVPYLQACYFYPTWHSIRDTGWKWGSIHICSKYSVCL